MSEFSYHVDVEKIESKEESFSLEANAEQRAALAKRYGVDSVELVKSTISLKRMKDGCTIHAKGKVTAKIIQKCVITLEPVQETIKEDIDAYYLDEQEVSSFRKKQTQKKNEDEDMVSSEYRMPDEIDDPEPVKGGVIDLGELVAQNISLGINPYPQAEGAEEKLDEKGFLPKEEKENPFAVLKDMQFSEDKG